MMFNGPAYDPKEDDNRLLNQLSRIKGLMLDGLWRTLREISEATGGDPEASVSAQLRHLRKKRFGSYTVERRSRGDRKLGLYEYQLLPPGTATSTTREWSPTRATASRLAVELEQIYNDLSASGKEPSEDFFQLILWLEKRGN